VLQFGNVQTLGRIGDMTRHATRLRWLTSETPEAAVTLAESLKGRRVRFTLASWTSF